MIETVKNIIGNYLEHNLYVRYLYYRIFRKKISLKERMKLLVDKGIYVICIVAPIAILPQAFNVFLHKSVEGLSLFTWTGYFILTFFWLAYGYLHKDRPMILTQILWLLVYGLVVIGIIIYK